jgi:hypothetical protein
MTLAQGIGFSRVGVYKVLTQSYMRLFPGTKKDVNYLAHVFHPCKNINHFDASAPTGIGGVFYHDDLIRAKDKRTYYVGAPEET